MLLDREQADAGRAGVTRSVLWGAAAAAVLISPTSDIEVMLVIGDIMTGWEPLQSTGAREEQDRPICARPVLAFR